MWNKNIDEGIFLCEHDSHILTPEFLESLSYVYKQLQFKKWLEPTEFLTNKTDFVAYILLRNNKDIKRAIRNYTHEIPLSNRRKNEVIQTRFVDGFWPERPYIYKLFDTKAKFDSICARCGNWLEIWEDECKECLDWELFYELDKSTPNVGAINCDSCEGFSFTFEGKRITYYCEYDLKAKKRGETNCEDCKEHFDWLDSRDW